MKKRHSFALYALVTPAVALGSGAVLAEQSTGQDAEHAPQNAQSDQYMGSAPANGMKASDLIGAGVKTTSDKKLGAVGDLVIDENGQVVAIVIGVGGFLSMGAKDVAIGWDSVTRSSGSDELVLRVDVSPEELRSAPKFEKQK